MWVTLWLGGKKVTRDQSLYLSTTFGEANYEQTFSEEKTKSKNKISGEKKYKKIKKIIQNKWQI